MLDSSAIDVHTEVFEGPLDLLLYLIKKDNLDIYDIPIAQITQEYLSYLDVMKELNLDTAGEFLLMAATLMQIKVRMLLPSQAESEQDQGPDPRVELAAKLAEYEKFKAAAQILDSKYDQFKDIFYRGSPKFAESDKVLNLELFDLLAAVKRAFDTVEDDGRTLAGELFPIETRMERIVSLLSQRDWILLDDVFKGEKKRLGIITCFMALLELMKQRKIFARQDKQFGEIRVYLSKDEPQAEAAAQEPPPAETQIQPAPPLPDEAAQPEQPAQTQETAEPSKESPAPEQTDNSAAQAEEQPVEEAQSQPESATPAEQQTSEEPLAEPPQEPVQENPAMPEPSESAEPEDAENSRAAEQPDTAPQTEDSQPPQEAQSAVELLAGAESHVENEAGAEQPDEAPAPEQENPPQQGAQ